MKFSFPKKIDSDSVFVAFSGGVDSVCAAHYFKNVLKKNVILAFQNHGNVFSELESEFLVSFSIEQGFMFSQNMNNDVKYSTSKEANWRVMRYNFFYSLSLPVITGHQLDDAVEHYVMTSIRGEGHYMPYQNQNVIRPFILTEKKDMLEYCIENKLSWLEDPSNSDVDFTQRNKVRHQIIPLMLEINPGLYNTVRRNLVRKINEPKISHHTIV